jgi:hypothetical protein
MQLEFESMVERCSKKAGFVKEPLAKLQMGLEWDQ